MTAPRWYSSPEPVEDYLFPEGEITLKVKARCRCGVRQVGPLRMAASFVQRLAAGERILPGDLAASAFCRDCKRTVKVTAGELHLA